MQCCQKASLQNTLFGGGDQNDREWTCFVHVSMWSIAYPRLNFILSKPIYFFYKQVMTLTKVFLCSYNWSWPVKWLPQAAGHCDICSHKAHPAVLLEFQGPPWARGWHRALPVWATGGSGPQTSGQCHGQSEYQGECGICLATDVILVWWESIPRGHNEIQTQWPPAVY